MSDLHDDTRDNWNVDTSQWGAAQRRLVGSHPSARTSHPHRTLQMTFTGQAGPEP